MSADAAAAPMLAVEALDAGYGALTIVYGIHFEIAAGECVLVFGPNGAGKSTLVKAIAGIAQVQAGTVRVAGHDVTGRAPERLVADGVAYVPQVDNVFRGLTVTENLEIGASVLPAARRRERIRAMFDFFPVLAERRRQRAGTLSGGERQQLSLARALVPEPRLLVLDEPSAGVAPKLVARIFEEVAGLKRLGTTVLMVEQNARQALGHVDRGLVMEAGRLRTEGTAAELLARDDIAALYLGGA